MVNLDEAASSLGLPPSRDTVTLIIAADFLVKGTLNLGCLDQLSLVIVTQE